MPTEQRHLPEQERSIKAREHEVFAERPRPATSSKSTKPFPVYLRETPAEPLSTFAKVVLWTVGIIVVLLFLAALWRIPRRQVARPKTARPPAGPMMLLEEMPGYQPGGRMATRETKIDRP
jgi:hypothetical protein